MLGQNCAYLMERGLGMLGRIRFIGNRYKVIADPSEIPEEIVKVSVYLHEGVEKYGPLCAALAAGQLRRGGPVLDRHDHRQQGVGVESLCRAGFAHDEVMASATTTTMWRCSTLSARLTSWTVPAPLRARYPLHTPRPEDAAEFSEMMIQPIYG